MSSEITFESDIVINKERITLRLHQYEEGLMLERELTEADGNTLTQSLPILSIESMRCFMDADVYRPQLLNAFMRIHSRVEASLSRYEP